MMFGIDVDDAIGRRLDKIVIENLFEEEGYTGLLGPAIRIVVGCRKDSMISILM